MNKTTITLNKEEFNKVMKVAYQVKASTKGSMSVNEFITLYKAMKTITTDTCAIDELVWSNYAAYAVFESEPDNELYELYERYNKAIGFIEYWTWEWEDLYNNLKYLTSQDKYWEEEYFEEFTTLD